MSDPQDDLDPPEIESTEGPVEGSDDLPPDEGSEAQEIGSASESQDELDHGVDFDSLPEEAREAARKAEKQIKAAFTRKTQEYANARTALEQQSKDISAVLSDPITLEILLNKARGGNGNGGSPKKVEADPALDEPVEGLTRGKLQEMIRAEAAQQVSQGTRPLHAKAMQDRINSAQVAVGQKFPDFAEHDGAIREFFGKNPYYNEAVLAGKMTPEHAFETAYKAVAFEKRTEAARKELTREAKVKSNGKTVQSNGKSQAGKVVLKGATPGDRMREAHERAWERLQKAGLVGD